MEESAKVAAEVEPERILNSRFAYRDKNYAKRKGDPTLGPKAKARLCVAGQYDPDLGVKDLATDAPTACRQSILLALQVALIRGWVASVGDIRAAFLNGLPAPRKLYFRQPRTGIPGLQPGQLVEVLKGVFGLSTSPKLWWSKLSTDLVKISLEAEKERVEVRQNPIDPCVFMFIGVQTGNTYGVLLTHVDDIMLLVEEGLEKKVHQELSSRFPIEYVGCEYACTPEQVKITQKNYAAHRVDKVTLLPGQKEGNDVTREQVEENRTSIGSLSWLAKQTRPDLQFAVSQAQRKQRNPTVEDIKSTNKIVDAAWRHQDEGIVLRRIAEDDLVFIAYHDAAWGNVEVDDKEVGDPEWLGGHQVASQLGSLVVAADRRCLHGNDGAFSVLHWQSKGCQRVCRSTFAGETMACNDAVEAGIYLRGLMLSIMKGQVIVEKDAGRWVPFHCITDCKSLYDHTHREGSPKAPSDKRLAIDLAGLRQVLFMEGRHQWEARHGLGPGDLVTPEKPCRPPIHWLPTGEQLADILTKILKADDWWTTMSRGYLNFPFRGYASGTTKSPI